MLKTTASPTFKSQASTRHTSFKTQRQRCMHILSCMQQVAWAQSLPKLRVQRKLVLDACAHRTELDPTGEPIFKALPDQEKTMTSGLAPMRRKPSLSTLLKLTATTRKHHYHYQLKRKRCDPAHLSDGAFNPQTLPSPRLPSSGVLSDSHGGIFRQLPGTRL